MLSVYTKHQIISLYVCIVCTCSRDFITNNYHYVYASLKLANAHVTTPKLTSVHNQTHIVDRIRSKINPILTTYCNFIPPVAVHWYVLLATLLVIIFVLFVTIVACCLQRRRRQRAQTVDGAIIELNSIASSIN